jgi:hypothetical protein
MIKGPSHFGANFLEVRFHLRFLASSQTLSPLENETNPLPFLADMTCWASSCAARASSRAVERVLSRDSIAGRLVLAMTAGRDQGLNPIMRKKGGFPVTEWGR